MRDVGGATRVQRSGALPSGEVTFVFTDIEGSTRLLVEIGEQDFSVVLGAQRDLVVDAFAAHGGVLVGAEGDGLFFACPTAAGAVRAAAAAHAGLAGAGWPGGTTVCVRIGMHTGLARPIGADYVGLAVHQAARVAAAAHGGQTLATATTLHAAGATCDGSTLGRFWLKDFDEPVELVQFGAGDFPPPRVVPEAVRRVPVPDTTFVGRAAELTQLSELLQTHRLVSVCGPGGVGKTRLALEAGAALPARWRVVVAELAAARTPEEVTAAVAAAAEVEQPERGTVADALSAELATWGEAVLVLDNCEQALDPIADLTETLLTAVPGLRVLTTTREPLDLTAERVLRLEPLSTPEPAGDPASVLGCEATRLLVDRLLAKDPTFVLDAQSARDAVALCRRLDGLPLAVELVAAEAAVIGLAATRASVEAGGEPSASRGRPERHRSVSAALEWSHDLCDPAERTLWARLAVFVAPFRLEDAVEVASGDGCDAVDVRSAVVALVNKSLLARVTAVDGLRYRMHQAVREFGLAKLRESGEELPVRDRHAAWVLAFHEANYLCEVPAGWYDVYGVRRDDSRAGFEHWRDTDQRDRAAMLGALVALHDMAGGRAVDGRDLFLELLRWPDGPHLARAYSLSAGWLHPWTDPHESLERAGRALRHPLTPAERQLVHLHTVLPFFQLLDTGAAIEAVRRSGALDDPQWPYARLSALLNLAFASLYAMDFAAARDCVEQARDLPNDGAVNESGVDGVDALVALLDGDHERAKTAAGRALALLPREKFPEHHAAMQLVLAGCHSSGARARTVEAVRALESSTQPFGPASFPEVLCGLRGGACWAALAVAIGAVSAYCERVGRTTPLFDRELAAAEAACRAGLTADAYEHWVQRGRDNPTYGEMVAALDA